MAPQETGAEPFRQTPPSQAWLTSKGRPLRARAGPWAVTLPGCRYPVEVPGGQWRRCTRCLQRKPRGKWGNGNISHWVAQAEYCPLCSCSLCGVVKKHELLVLVKLGQQCIFTSVEMDYLQYQPGVKIFSWWSYRTLCLLWSPENFKHDCTSNDFLLAIDRCVSVLPSATVPLVAPCQQLGYCRIITSSNVLGCFILSFWLLL